MLSEYQNSEFTNVGYYVITIIGMEQVVHILLEISIHKLGTSSLYVIFYQCSGHSLSH